MPDGKRCEACEADHLSITLHLNADRHLRLEVRGGGVSKRAAGSGTEGGFGMQTMREPAAGSGTEGGFGMREPAAGSGTQGGFGMRTMREPAEQIGGNL